MRAIPTPPKSADSETSGQADIKDTPLTETTSALEAQSGHAFASASLL